MQSKIAIIKNAPIAWGIFSIINDLFILIASRQNKVLKLQAN